MKKHILTLLFTCLASLTFTQSNIILQGDSLSANSGAYVQYPLYVTNFWNVTNFNCSMHWDPAVLEFDTINFFGLPYMAIDTFDTSMTSSGTLSWEWWHLITIGSALNDGDSVFSVRFKAIGAPGSSSRVWFNDTPVTMYWYNFAAWSGSIDTLPGLVNIQCAAMPTAAFSDSLNGLMASFTNMSTGAGPNYAWTFGDGNTSTMTNPVHTYSAEGTFEVCLITTDACGADTTCDSVTVIVPVARDEYFEKTLSVYPIPANEFLYVKGWRSLEANAHIEFWGIEGRKFELSADLNGAIRVSNLPNGMYIMRVGKGEKQHSRKVLIQH